MRQSDVIPPIVHFCWIGPVLPWAYAFAILSAAMRSGLPDIRLHHTDDLTDAPPVQALRRAPGVTLHRLDPHDCLAQAGAVLGLGSQLSDLYQRLPNHVMRSDMLRAALLFQHGGIYLDLDTVTIAPLRPLLQVPQFVGSEFIVWPPRIRASRSPLVWARHLCLDAARTLLRHLPQGWRIFRHLEPFYVRAVNNAVMGARPGAPLLCAYLRSMLSIPLTANLPAATFGPHLLQQTLAGLPPGSVTIHPPHVFSPLPPQISEHWFRTRRRVSLANVTFADTQVVHWYASVHTGKRVAGITPGTIHHHRQDQFYSMLIAACLGAALPAP